MNQRSTRKILVYIMSFVIALCSTLVALNAVASATIANKNFYINNLSNAKLVNECNNQLAEKYDTLSKKSGLPADLFNSVTTAFDTSEAIRQATSYLFDENDSTMYSDSKITFFYDSCAEYLEVNNIKYDENSIMNVAKEAAQIYSDAVGIHNFNGVNEAVFHSKNYCIKVLSVCVAIIFVMVFLIINMYRENEKAILYIGSAVIGSGIADLIISALLFVTKIGSRYKLYPDVYSYTFWNMTSKALLYGFVAGVLFLALGALIFSIGAKQAKRRQSRSDTRFLKIIDKL